MSDSGSVRVRKRRPLWHRLLLYGGIFLGAYVALCLVLARTYLAPARLVPELPPQLREVRLSDRTPAWITPNLEKSPSSVVFVFAHGYGGSRRHWQSAVADLRANGYDSIVPAMPGQDASPHPRVGFGEAEAKVLLEAVAWVRAKNPRVKIVLVGVSMGGAAVWLASEKDPTVDAVVTEGAYARFDRAMLHWFDQALPGGSVLLRPVVWIASAQSGIDPAKIVPEEAARKWRGRPSLVIQASNDVLIEGWHADRLAKAAGCQLWDVPNADHAQCSGVAQEEFARRLVSIARSLPPK